MEINFFSSAVVMSVFATLAFGTVSNAHDGKKCHCSKKDEQSELAQTCEKNMASVNGRVECLSGSRLVATIEFCSRQYGSERDRLECIKKIDKVD